MANQLFLQLDFLATFSYFSSGSVSVCGLGGKASRKCVCVYMYKCVGVCINTDMHTYVHTRSQDVHTHTHTLTHTHMYRWQQRMRREREWLSEARARKEGKRQERRSLATLSIPRISDPLWTRSMFSLATECVFLLQNVFAYKLTNFSPKTEQTCLSLTKLQLTFKKLTFNNSGKQRVRNLGAQSNTLSFRQV